MARNSKANPAPVADLPAHPSNAVISRSDDAPPPIESAVESTNQEARTIFDKLKTKANAEKMELENKWNEIVEKLASDNANELEVENILKVTGRPIDELRAAADRQRKISRLESLIADLPAALEAQREAQQEFNAVKDRHKKLREEMEAEFKSARGQTEHSSHSQNYRRASEARPFLR